MSYTPLETKLRLEMLANAPLVAIFGTNFYGSALPQGVMSAASPLQALTVQRISTTRISSHTASVTTMAAIRMQFTAWCKGPNSEAQAISAMKALVDFLNTFCATSTALFTSPPTVPAQFPNTILNERITSYPNTLPPLYMGILDARIYNREDL